MLALSKIGRSSLSPRVTRVAAASQRSFWSSGGSTEVKMEVAKPTDEMVSISDAEDLLRAGIRSIGYNEQDTEVMKDASA